MDHCHHTDPPGCIRKMLMVIIGEDMEKENSVSNPIFFLTEYKLISTGREEEGGTNGERSIDIYYATMDKTES